MKREIIAALLSALSLTAGGAVYGEEADAPIGFHGSGIIVEVRKGVGPIAVLPAPAITYLDEPHNIRCLDVSGCLLIVQAHSKIDAFGYICAYLNGKPIHPSCGDTIIPITGSLQSQHLKQGSYVVQTGFQSTSTDTNHTLGPWETVYTLYDNGQ